MPPCRKWIRCWAIAEKLTAASYADFGVGRSEGARQRHYERARNCAADGGLFRRPDPRLPAGAEWLRSSLHLLHHSLMAGAIRAASGMGAVVAEARRLAENGFAEIVLTGVDLTSYGADLARARPRLGTLVRKLLKLVPEIKRLRLSSIDSIEADADSDARHRRGGTADAAFPSFGPVGRRSDPQAHEAPPQPRRHHRVLRHRCGGSARRRVRRRPHRRLSHRKRSDVPEQPALVDDAGLSTCMSFPSARARARRRRACRKLRRGVAKERAARLRAKGESGAAPPALPAMVGSASGNPGGESGFGHTRLFRARASRRRRVRRASSPWRSLGTDGRPSAGKSGGMRTFGEAPPAGLVRAAEKRPGQIHRRPAAT